MSNRHACLVVFYNSSGVAESNQIVDIDYVNRLCVDFNNGVEKRSFKAYDIGDLLAAKSTQSETAYEATFRDELESLINKYCLERHSHTPDFILAEFMADCLAMFNKAVFARTKFYAPVGEAVEQITALDASPQDAQRDEPSGSRQ